MKHNFSRSNLIPFKTIFYYLAGNERFEFAFTNLAGNLILFLPAGILLPLLSRRFQHVKKIILATFIISISIEIVQLFTCLGVFDVDDILLNIAGAVIGYSVFTFLRKPRPHITPLI